MRDEAVKMYMTHDSHGALVIGSAGSKLDPGNAIAEENIVTWRCPHQDCAAVIALEILITDNPNGAAQHVAVMINEMRLHELEHQGHARPLHPMLAHLNGAV